MSLFPYLSLIDRAGGNGTAGMAMAVPVFEEEKNGISNTLP